MKSSKITTAAFLAGATTLAVSLPVTAEERSYDLDGFDGVNISSGLSAEVKVGSDFSVIAEAQSTRTLDQLNIRVRKGTLVVERDGSWADYSIFAARRDATIRITLPELKNIQADAGSDVYVDGASGGDLQATLSSGADLEFENMDMKRVRFDVSSGADLDAAGACDRLEAYSSSGSNIDAGELNCETVEAHASSGGNIDAHANESLTARASSGGNIDVFGGPEAVEKHESSGGDVDVN